MKNSIFTLNVIDDTNAELCNSTHANPSMSGGASIAIYGSQVFIKLENSSFTQNKAMKGGGVYIRVSDNLHNIPSSQIVIAKCKFVENVGSYGGGLMVDFNNAYLGNEQTISISINDSIMSKNAANFSGAGVHLCFYKVTLGNHASFLHIVLISV